ncbi:hypothetical protein [Streptomyces lincolnensis]|uniref:hypothetical protein n=1 Tax=Streptomyces TaxID=1883 RepID=UPI001E6161D1|nr:MULTISPECIES: hypothetical protein [Streptomyces]MCD7443068.1 hypothetical protein [Streptomyces lincolnensis]WLW51671.1 hypothetical protein QU709_09940 [Streptomyces coralus]
MTTPQSSVDGPLVTIQTADIPAVHGVLVADETVFVPHPPPALVTASKLNALIKPGTDDGTRAESIDVTDVRVMGLDDGETRASLAVLTLAEPSALRRKVPQYSAAQLGDAIANHAGDLWAALASLGYEVPTGASRDSAPESSADLRTFAGPGASAVETHDSIEAFADRGCLYCGCCLPPKPPADGR